MERRRFIVLTLLRAGGVVVMLIALGVWFGHLLPEGDRIGPPIFVLGVVESLLVPAVLAARWRTPPRP